MQNLETLKNLSQNTYKIISSFAEYASAFGYNYSEDLIKSIYLSLKAKPIIFLSGISGAGKSEFFKMWAEFTHAEIKFVTVHRDWADLSELLGYNDTDRHFVKGQAYSFVESALSSQNKPHFLFLENANVARADLFLNDILSAMERKEKIHISENASLSYPENLYIVCSMEKNEYNYPLSERLTDSANIIEFPVPELNISFGKTPPKTVSLDNSFYKTTYSHIWEYTKYTDFISEICFELERINEFSNSVSFKSRDEILFFMLCNKEEYLMPYEDAFDFVLCQRILPKIKLHGERARITLQMLKNYCAPSESSVPNDKFLEFCRYKRSYLKINSMLEDLAENSCVSFFE